MRGTKRIGIGGGRQGDFAPLDEATVIGAEKGTVSVRDGEGREYVRAKAGEDFRFTVGGTLGNHLVLLEDEGGRVTDSAGFRVNCRTEIADEGGRFRELLAMLHYTMIHFGETDSAFIDGKSYRFFVRWLRDHVHTMKGMKYFCAELKSAIELYRDTQRKDGMIWDNVYERDRQSSYWDQSFSYGDFIRPVADGMLEMKRIPVENDVEYLFIEGIYYTWKATGDDAWMASMLDSAVRAYRYSVTSPYRWSRKFGLLKRGFTIDTWDFQAEEDTARTGHTMVVRLDKTRFGVMHGDNTGFAAGCRYLAEMLDRVGRAKEAEKHRRLGEEIKRRLDKVSWNGRFYTHHVPEDPSAKRAFGVDLSKQMSLSNSYALNRGLTHRQCAAIIREYQRIRKNLPPGSPGEWYAIYPPFPKGFGRHDDMWEYMNGGVLSIVAGELAHGAFEHGFEEYGTDVLDRISKLARSQDGYLPCTFRGSMPPPPKRRFVPLSVAKIANADFRGNGAKGVPGWSGEGGNDLREMPVGKRTLAGIPFIVVDPAKNGRRACVGLCDKPGYTMRAELPVGRKARSVCFLHAAAKGGGGGPAGSIILNYADGTSFHKYVTVGSEVQNWWYPPRLRARRGAPNTAIAWQGKNAKCLRVGVIAYALENPHPEKEIASIVLEGSKSGIFWFVLGVTLCDSAMSFPPDPVSFGIPDNWGAAAVVYALMEGLAGVKDTGVAYDRAVIAPRWEAANVSRTTATAKYEASGGYVRYRYGFDRKRKTLDLIFTGNARVFSLELLLPRGAAAASVTVDGRPVKFELRKVESSAYACVEAVGVGVHWAEVRLR